MFKEIRGMSKGVIPCNVQYREYVKGLCPREYVEGISKELVCISKGLCL